MGPPVSNPTWYTPHDVCSSRRRIEPPHGQRFLPIDGDRTRSHLWKRDTQRPKKKCVRDDGCRVFFPSMFRVIKTTNGGGPLGNKNISTITTKRTESMGVILIGKSMSILRSIHIGCIFVGLIVVLLLPPFPKPFTSIGGDRKDTPMKKDSNFGVGIP